MSYKKLQAPLEIKDIDFRVQSVNKGGYATILAYKDARVDMKRLDDVLGAEYWQRDVKFINGVLYGGVGIYNKELGEWVWKWDAGTESNTEKEKGQSSDAFKRACFNLGIGRELYNYPLISIKLNENEVDLKGAKPKATWNFKLKEWTWLSQFTDGEITFLAAKDQTGKLRFKWGSYDKDRDQIESKASGAPTSNPEEHLEESPTTVSVQVTTPQEEEQGNPEGLLKKDAEPTEDETSLEKLAWDKAAKKYKELYGKTPSSRTKLETLLAKIEEKENMTDVGNPKDVYSASGEPADEEPVEELKATEEEPQEVEEITDLGMYGSDIAEDAEKIATFTDKDEFKNWAVETFKKWDGKISEEHKKEFQEACNNHFEKIG